MIKRKTQLRHSLFGAVNADVILHKVRFSTCLWGWVHHVQNNQCHSAQPYQKTDLAFHVLEGWTVAEARGRVLPHDTWMGHRLPGAHIPHGWDKHSCLTSGAKSHGVVGLPWRWMRGSWRQGCLHGLFGRLRHHCKSRAAWRVLCRCGVVALQVRPSARSIGCPGLRRARCRESAVSHEGRAGALQGCQRVQNTQLTCTSNFSTRFSPSQPETSPSWPINAKQYKNLRVFN